MTASKDLLSDLIEKYDKVLKLTGEERKYDPPTEPYKSYYAARAILLEMSEIVKNHIETLNDSPEEAKRFKVIYAHITLDAGKIFIGTDETAIGEKYLNNSMHMLSGIESHPSGVCAYVDILNEYGGLWTNRGETEKAKDLLMKAESSYNAFKATKQTPLACQDLLDEESEVKLGARNLEKLHALTQFYLAQVYGLLGDLEKSAICCHTTLKMQLDLNEFDTIDWALNAATLSQYFCTNDRFTEARHHLAAATQILIEYEKDMLKPGMSDDEKGATEETFNHRLADVNRCWVKYGLNLMSDSRDRLMQDNEETGIGSLNISPLTFGTRIDSAYENVVTDRYLLDIDDARPVFVTVQKWIEKAKSYYTSETEATEYSKIVQDHAMAYKHLAFFENDSSLAAKMHKRRADLLEDLLKILNKEYYLNIVREVQYELGMAYSNILDIKLEAFERTQKEPNPVINPQSLKKINELIVKSRNILIEYISSYYEPKTEVLKPNLDMDELIPIAFAYFQVARMSYKFVTPDKQLLIENLTICLENYKKLVTVSDSNEELADKMKHEVGISKEMARLLPLKIQRLNEIAGTNIPQLTA